MSTYAKKPETITAIQYLVAAPQPALDFLATLVASYTVNNDVITVPNILHTIHIYDTDYVVYSVQQGFYVLTADDLNAAWAFVA